MNTYQKYHTSKAEQARLIERFLDPNGGGLLSGVQPGVCEKLELRAPNKSPFAVAGLRM